MDGSSPFKFRSQAVLLTYQGFSEVVATALEQWRRFVTWVGGLLGGWGATLWTATLETNKDGKHHAHLMVEFTQNRERDVKDFTFEGLRPNAQPNSDTLGESRGKNCQTHRWQSEGECCSMQAQRDVANSARARERENAPASGPQCKIHPLRAICQCGRRGRSEHAVPMFMTAAARDKFYVEVYC